MHARFLPEISSFQSLTCSLAVQLGLFGQPHTCGEVLQASFNNCSIRPAPVDTGAAVVRLPSPTAILQFSSTFPYLACNHSAASLPPINAPPFTSLAATLRFSDGSRREMSDARAHITVEGPCIVIRDQNGSPHVHVREVQSGPPTNASSCAAGVCTISLTYPTLNETLKATLTIPVVDVESIFMVPQHYDAPAACIVPANSTLSDFAAAASSSTSSVVQLAQLACSPQDYQQATVCMIAQLTTSVKSSEAQQALSNPLQASFLSHVDVSAYSKVQVSDGSRVIVHPNLVDRSVLNRIRPKSDGQFYVSAVFGDVKSAAMPVVAMAADKAVQVQSIQLELRPALQGRSTVSGTAVECGYQCQNTLSGPRTTSSQLSATVTLTDGYQYSPDTLLGGSNSGNDIINVTHLFSVESSHPGAISVSELGDLSLLDNAAEAVTIEMRARTCSNGPVSTVRGTGRNMIDNTTPDATQDTPMAVLEVFANLRAAMLDVDIGEQFGPPLQFQAGDSSSVRTGDLSPQLLQVSSRSYTWTPTRLQWCSTLCMLYHSSFLEQLHCIAYQFNPRTPLH
jgi:hypothetical protein